MNLYVFWFFVLFFLSTAAAYAHGGADKPVQRNITKSKQLSALDDESNKKEMHGKLVQEKRVGEFELKFKIVDVKESVPDGGSHNLLVNIKRNGRHQKRLIVTSVVEELHGEIKSKSMMEMGDWHLAGYNFTEDGKYVITVSFKSKNGIAHSSTISYP